MIYQTNIMEIRLLNELQDFKSCFEQQEMKIKTKISELQQEWDKMINDYMIELNKFHESQKDNKQIDDWYKKVSEFHKRQVQFLKTRNKINSKFKKFINNTLMDMNKIFPEDLIK